MAKYLKFSPQLRLPIEAVTQQFAFIGRTGSVAFAGAGVLAECLLDAKAQVVILDPVGNWWGLRDGAWRMLEALMARPRDRVSRSILADLAEMDVKGGSFRTYLSDIKRTGLVTTTRQDVGIAPGMLELV